MRRIEMAIAAAALVGSLMSVTTSEAQAPNAMVAQYGYPFCAIIGGGPDSMIHDCMYSTMDQCQASASGHGYCVENSAYLAAGANAAVSATGPAPHRARRHRRVRH